jgi:hypothetical protein
MASATTITQTPYVGTLPSQIPGLALWLDAADLTTITMSGSSVTQWRDKSSNNHICISNANYAGTTLPTFCNIGQRCVNLAPNQALVISSNWNYSPAWSCFVAINSISLAPRWLISPHNSVTPVLMGMNQGTNKIFNSAFNTAPPDITGQNIEYTSAENTNATSNLLWFRNGTLQASNVRTLSAGPNSNAQMGIGANATFNNSMGGIYQLYEVLIFNRYISTIERQQIEAYLAFKWGLQGNMPLSHPYYTNPLYENTVIAPNTLENIFRPTDIPGCALWLDAADSSTIQFSSGAIVSIWRDKSGNGFNASSFNSPTFSSNSIVFSGGQFFTTSLSSLIPDQSGFSVALFNSINRLNILSLRRTTVSGTAGIQQIIVNNQQLITTYGGTSIVTGATLPQNTRLLYNHSFSASCNAFLYANGLQTGTTTGPYIFTGAGTVNIGAFDLGGGEGFRGNMNEIILYSNVLTTQQRQQVEGYLMWKWGIQMNLPLAHPYYNNAIAPIPIAIAAPTTCIQTPNWLPTNLLGLALWLDGADSAVIQTINTSDVIQWNDKSGNSRHAFGRVNNYPTYDGMRNGIQFNGTNQFLSNLNAPVNLSQRSIFIVLSNTVYTIYAGVFPQIPNPSSGEDYTTTTGLTIETSVGLRFYGNTGGYQNDIVTTINPSIPYGIYYEQMNGRSGTTYRNGNFNATVIANYTAGTSRGYAIGCRWSGNVAAPYFNGVINEIVMYSNVLTSSQRQQVEGYLAWKWRLHSSLPSTHPNFFIPAS